MLGNKKDGFMPSPVSVRKRIQEPRLECELNTPIPLSVLIAATLRVYPPQVE